MSENPELDVPIVYGTVTLPGTVVDAVVDAKTDQAVEAWFVDHFYNVAGMSTELFNRFRNAADDLKARLRQMEL